HFTGLQIRSKCPRLDGNTGIDGNLLPGLNRRIGFGWIRPIRRVTNSSVGSQRCDGDKVRVSDVLWERIKSRGEWLPAVFDAVYCSAWPGEVKSALLVFAERHHAVAAGEHLVLPV